MQQYDYDLVVIGGGPAGERGAAQAAYFGHRTALVECQDELGGACINTGTLASKTLRESALFLSGAKTRQLYGINTSVKRDITLADFMHRKNHVQQMERQRARANLARHKIDLINGFASFVDPHTISVKRRDGAGPRRVTSNVFLIATGTSPARPDSIPFNPDNVFDSDTVLEMRAIPKSMIVIGGGVIGCEYACLFAALGLQVCLVHRATRVMEFLDAELAEALMGAMRGAGVTLMMEEELESCTRDGDDDGGAGVRVKLKSGRDVVAESMLYAVGRAGNTAGMNLEALGIAVNKRGQIENVKPPGYQTSVPNIYAAGDVIGVPALASTSMEQARMAMCHAFELTYRKSKALPLLPMGIYTIPEISAAGESEESCQSKGIPYVVGRNRFGQHARGHIIGDADGMIKLLFSAPEGKLLGVHVIGEVASEIVHIGMACLHFGGGIDYFIESVFNYPTLSDVYKYAAFDALHKLNELRGTAPDRSLQASTSSVESQVDSR